MLAIPIAALLFAAVCVIAAPAGADLKRVETNRSSVSSVALPRSTLERIDQLKSQLEAQERDTGTFISLPADVLFDFDQATIRPDAAGALAKIAELVTLSQAPAVEITGHTDAKGSDAYNMDLSRRRATAVRDWLVERHQLSADLFTVHGRGEHEPVAANTNPDGTDNPAGRQKNRRVEFLITRPGS